MDTEKRDIITLVRGVWVWVLFVLVFGLSFGCLAGAVVRMIWN